MELYAALKTYSFIVLVLRIYLNPVKVEQNGRTSINSGSHV
jgi:hypothetical protein